jgi:hypothetical protein
MGTLDFLLSCRDLIDKRLTVKLDFVHCDVGAARRHHNGQSRVKGCLAQCAKLYFEDKLPYVK